MGPGVELCDDASMRVSAFAGTAAGAADGEAGAPIDPVCVASPAAPASSSIVPSAIVVGSAPSGAGPGTRGARAAEPAMPTTAPSGDAG